MSRQFFKANRADVDAAMRAKSLRDQITRKAARLRDKQALRAAAKQLRETAIGAPDETETKTKPDVQAEPETVEPADTTQESVSELRPMARVRQVDHRPVPKQIWVMDSESFREETFSMPHLRQGTKRQ